jgi:hypothetical protein
MRTLKVNVLMAEEGWYDAINYCLGGKLDARFVDSINKDNVNSFHTASRITSPLKRACMFHCDHVVRFLLDRGATPGLACYEGFAPLHTLATFCIRDKLDVCVKILYMLVDAGADVNAVTKLGRSVLCKASGSNAKFIYALVDCGARPTSKELRSGQISVACVDYIRGRGKCLAAARTMLLIWYQRRERTLLHMVGKDIVRLLAMQWVWGTRTDPIWLEQ